MKYNTEQKSLILSILETNHRELTVNEIYNLLEKKVGLTTIYRLVNELVNDEKIIKINNEKTATFIFIEDDDENYLHMRCSACGNTIHINKNDIIVNGSHQIDFLKSVLIGKCSKCLNINGGLSL